MEKSRRPVLTPPSKITSLSKSSSFSTGKSDLSSNSSLPKIQSSLTRQMLSKSPSSPDTQLLSKRPTLELLQQKQNGSQNNISISNSSSNPETPTNTTVSSFQLGMSPIRKLSYKTNKSSDNRISLDSTNEQKSPESKRKTRKSLLETESLVEPSLSMAATSDGSVTSENSEIGIKCENVKILSDVKKLNSQDVSSKSVISVDCTLKENTVITDDMTGTTERSRDRTSVDDSEVLKQVSNRSFQKDSVVNTGVSDKDRSGNISSESTGTTEEKCGTYPSSGGTPEASAVKSFEKQREPENEQRESEGKTLERTLNFLKTNSEVENSEISTRTCTSSVIKSSGTSERTPEIVTGTSGFTSGSPGTLSGTSKTFEEQLETGTISSSGISSGTPIGTILPQNKNDKSLKQSKMDTKGGKYVPPQSTGNYGTHGTPEMLSASARDENDISNSINSKSNKQLNDSVNVPGVVTKFVENTGYINVDEYSAGNVSIDDNLVGNNSVDEYTAGTFSVDEQSSAEKITSSSVENFTNSKEKSQNLENKSSGTTRQETGSSSPILRFFSRSKGIAKGSNKASKFRNMFSSKDKDKKSSGTSPKFKLKNKKYSTVDDYPQIWEISDSDDSGSSSLLHPVASEPHIGYTGLIRSAASAPNIASSLSADNESLRLNKGSKNIVYTSTPRKNTDSSHLNHHEISGRKNISLNQMNSENSVSSTSASNLPHSTTPEPNVSVSNLTHSSLSKPRARSFDMEKSKTVPDNSMSLSALSSGEINPKNMLGNSIGNSENGTSDPVKLESNVEVTGYLSDLSEVRADKSLTDIQLYNNNSREKTSSNKTSQVKSESEIKFDTTPIPPVRRHSTSRRQNTQLTLSPTAQNSSQVENLQQTHLSSGSNVQTPTQTSSRSRLSSTSSQVESGTKYEMSQNSTTTKPVTSRSNVATANVNTSCDVDSMPAPIPSPRRRLRRRFSLGLRKLDDDEFIGFASLPEQVHRKAVKRGFEFSLMVVGESGLGKSTLINSLFLTDLYKDRNIPTVQDNVSKTVDISKKYLEIEERGVKLRLTIVDTPGFNDAVNGEECWKNIIDYVDNQFEQYYKAESGLNRKNIQDSRVHCCLYFISPYGHGCILQEIEDNQIQIYQFPDCDSDEDEEFKEQDKALKAAIPFAVVGSNTVVEAGGKRIRGRMYPWGIVEVDNPSHCDFIKLRQMLISTHMQDLKDITSDIHYENYRAEHLASEMNKSQRERSKLKRDSAPNMESVVETEKLLQQKEAEIQRMQAMLAKMQAQLQNSPGQKINGKVTNTQL